MQNQEKQKRDGEKQYYKEWSFSFENMGERLSEFFGGLGEEAELKLASFSQVKEDTQSVTVNLHFPVGETTVKPLMIPDYLFEADLTHLGEVEFMVTGEAHKHITLKQKSGKPFGSNLKQALGAMGKELRWDVRLNPQVPTQLHIKGGVGKGEFDLRDLTLTDLQLDTGTGKNEISLPESAQGYDVNIKGGVGETVISLPANTTMSVKINAGVGEVRVHLPALAALRVKAQSGIGDVKLPENMQRLSGGREFVSVKGVWQTPGFENAPHQINLEFNGGVGELKIISDVTVV